MASVMIGTFPTNRIDMNRAIYVDIEALQTDPPHCALIGVLPAAQARTSSS